MLDAYETASGSILDLQANPEFRPFIGRVQSVLADPRASLDDMIDRYLVDGLVNTASRWLYGLGTWFHGAETGKLRQYVMFIVVGTVVLFVLISFYLNPSLAGH